MTRAVFIDKDGTLVVDVPFNADPARIELTPRAGEGLRALAAAGFLLFVASNQSGIARGYFGEADLPAVERRVTELLSAEGVTLDGFYWCPHDPAGTEARYAMPCTCRKPEPGLLLRAAAEHDVDLGASWVVGDILDDVEAGRRAGCRTVLLDNGGETEWMLSPSRIPHEIAPDLGGAARRIVKAAEAAHG